jgi:predicted PurR-regulated permease PerM
MQPMPITVRRSIELVGVFVLGYLIISGREIIMPLVMAFFIAIVMLPFYRFLRNRRFPEVLSIALSLLMLVVLVGLLIWFFSSQIARLVSDFPQIRENVMLHLNSLSAWIN